MTTNTILNTIAVDMQGRANIEFASGDTVRVWSKLKDSDGKVRLQAFEGLVLARKHGAEAGATFTVRRVASGVGVERIFPLYSMNIDKIEIVRHAITRRSKLYYVREKAVRDVRRRMKVDTKRVSKNGVTTAVEVAPETEEVAAE